MGPVRTVQKSHGSHDAVQPSRDLESARCADVRRCRWHNAASSCCPAWPSPGPRMTLPAAPVAPTARATPRVLSFIPPMTQLNTPYPSTAYLTGFLRQQGVDAAQEDLALALVLRLLSRAGLQSVRDVVDALPASSAAARSQAVRSFAKQADAYLATIDRTIAFLQGRDATLAHRIAGRGFLPEGPRFAALDHYVHDDEEGGDPLACRRRAMRWGPRRNRWRRSHRRCCRRPGCRACLPGWPSPRACPC